MGVSGWGGRINPRRAGGQYIQYANVTVGSADRNIDHLHAIYSDGGSLGVGGSGGVTLPHNNMPPWCAVALIIKVTGVTINSGGALVGATGQRGAVWYLYNGTGTPPAGTFVGELDGDWAIRKTDGENFERQRHVGSTKGFTNSARRIGGQRRRRMLSKYGVVSDDRYLRGRRSRLTLRRFR